MNILPLLAQTTSVVRSFELGRIRDPQDWLLPVAVTALVTAYTCWMYVLDARELRRSTAALLVGLRVLAFLALAFLWLQPQWRTEETRAVRSRVVLMVDTSLSMGEPAIEGTPDALAIAVAAGADPNTTRIPDGTRSADAARFIEEAAAEMRKQHDVHIVTFDAGRARSQPVLPYVGQAGADAAPVALPLAELAPAGDETRLGDAVGQVLFEHRAAPVSGIVILSDGGQNTGVDPIAAVNNARADHLPIPPIFTVGIGSPAEIKNVLVQSVAAPPRVYPTDEFPVRVQVQGHGVAGESVKVELEWRDAAGNSPGEVERVRAPGQAAAGQGVVFPAEGEPPTVDFILRPKKLGPTVITVRLADPPAGDRNPLDNVMEVDVDITERRNKILLFASAATREYQFLRNQLQRLLLSNGTKDKEFVVDVFLQTGSLGISQDSSVILSDFPSDEKSMFDYDCVVAFDPDWRRLNDAQIDLLQRWVAEKAGGLILVAGRINTEYVARDPRLSLIRGLYPIEFGRVVAMPGESASSSKAWKLELTADGKKSEFLRMTDSGGIADFWYSFSGFYDCFPAKSAKDKAVVLAGLVDPDSAALGSEFADNSKSLLLVEQPLGAGRVMYVGSGEFWRLRLIDSRLFTRLYTQMVRHAAQARLLRDSKHGVLMLNHENGKYSVNDIVEIRAQLTDSRQKPLELEEVPLQVIEPDNSISTETLVPDKGSAPGTYTGSFRVRRTGPYRLDVILPESGGEPLTRRLQVQASHKESDNPRMNAELMRRLAEASIDPSAEAPPPTTYYEGIGQALDGRGEAGQPDFLQKIVDLLYDRTRFTPELKPAVPWLDTIALTINSPEDLRALPAAMRSWFGRGSVAVRYQHFAIAILCFVLCLEWFIRRMSKLA